MTTYTASKTVGEITTTLITDDKEYMTWFLTGEDTPSSVYPVNIDELNKDIKAQMKRMTSL